MKSLWLILLTFVPPAWGQIIAYIPERPITVRLSFVVGDPSFFGQTALVDLNFDGKDDVSIVAGPSITSIRTFDLNQVVAFNIPPNLNGQAIPLDYGVLIGPDEGLDWFSGSNNLSIVTNVGSSGTFLGVEAYIGVEFLIEDSVHYGWILYDGFSRTAGGNIRGWAYEATPGVPISAGAIPEPSTYLLMILGGLAVFVYLRLKL